VIEINHVDKLDERGAKSIVAPTGLRRTGKTTLLNTRAAYRTSMRLAIRIVVKGG
jgi:predicted AAA+ superfamily ATPase